MGRQNNSLKAPALEELEPDVELNLPLPEGGAPHVLVELSGCCRSGQFKISTLINVNNCHVPL